MRVLIYHVLVYMGQKDLSCLLCSHYVPWLMFSDKTIEYTVNNEILINSFIFNQFLLLFVECSIALAKQTTFLFFLFSPLPFLDRMSDVETCTILCHILYFKNDFYMTKRLMAELYHPVCWLWGSLKSGGFWINLWVPTVMEIASFQYYWLTEQVRTCLHPLNKFISFL